ncbi:hypothetical protein VTI74DRAFT_10533 [Chaetomium olivicolor]
MMSSADVDTRPHSSIVSPSRSVRARQPSAASKDGPSPCVSNRDAGGDASPVANGANVGVGEIEERRASETKPGVGIQLEQGLGITEYFSQSHAQTNQRHETPFNPAKPFQKWIKTLHKRALRRHEMFGYDGAHSPWPLGKEDGYFGARASAHHRQSSSGSSIGFVTGVKSPSMSLTGVSVFARSRRTTVRSSRDQRTDRSSRASVSGPRVSEDGSCVERQAPLDPAVVERSLQRRRILEELISTEEGYIGDVRFLMNVYVTILASLPTTPAGLRSSVNRNLTDIVELHEEILGELHRAVPHSEYTQLDSDIQRPKPNRPARGHHRWRSLDAVPEGRDGPYWFPDMPGTMSEPQTAAEVAKIFLRRMNRFFIYEEYGAKYELMIKGVAAAQRTIPGWLSYQKGLEVLASSLGSADSHGDNSRKSLTIGDLLVKPIQRACKYPLLFSELLKYTPVIDCPYSHMEIENTLIRLREATAEINRATNDSRTKSVLEKTWILQDRLAFPDCQLDTASKSRIRSFGHIQLCGALHVCWQTKEGVDGQYMVALLYRDWLCLATAGKFDQIYTIQACVALTNIRVEEVDNGRGNTTSALQFDSEVLTAVSGLQCHTARYSWKIVFLCDNQLYELIMTACSPKEELEWRARLRNPNEIDNPDGQDQVQPDVFSFLALNIKTLGTVFRKPGTIARKISIHRATTIGPRSALYQVILKNTSVIKETSPSSHSSQINRSQSLLTTNNRIPVLAPSRSERARLEALLSDVWTRDVLPFPGITARSRSEHLVRSSASSVMRKLSAVSIASTFTRRSASLASVHQKERVDAVSDAERGPASEMSPKTPTPVLHLEDAGASPVLSAPWGQMDGCSSPLPHFQAAAVSEVKRDTKLKTVCQNPAYPASTPELNDSYLEMPPVLRKSSGNSTSPGGPSVEQVNLGEKSPSVGEEGVRQPDCSPTSQGWKQGNASRRLSRLSGKFGKGGGGRREVVVEGFRSWFR